MFGSIPVSILEKWAFDKEKETERISLLNVKEQDAAKLLLNKEQFNRFEAFLESDQAKLHYFKDDFLAGVVADSLLYWHTKKIELYAFCIMSNHVHVLFRTLVEEECGRDIELCEIMQSIKRHSATACNKILKKKGQFWQRESFDRLIRDEDEFFEKLYYTLHNPVKAGLCKNPSDWKFSYCHPDYVLFD